MSGRGPRARIVWSIFPLATAARVAHGLLFAAAAALALEPRDATFIFQLLFLQGGLVALLSASSYARAAHLSSQGRDAGAVSAFLRFVTIASVIATAAGFLFLPRYGQPAGTHAVVVALVVIGAASAAFTALLQGLVVGSGASPARAFGPVLGVTTLASAVTVASMDVDSLVWFVCLWTAPQLLTSVVLLASSRWLRQLVSADRGRSPEAGSAFALTGVLNGASVGLAYQFRERWTVHHPEFAVSQSFFIVRVTELVYQVLYMASASAPRQVEALSDHLLSTRLRRLLVLALGVGFSALGLVPVVGWSEWSAERFVIAEILASPARLLSMVLMLSLLARESARSYLIAQALAMVAAGTLMATAVQSSPYGLQAFQTVGAVCVVVTALASRRIGDRGVRLPA